MEIFRTNPVTDGRYLAFTSAEGAQEWCLPVVLLWQGHWTYEYSKQPFPRKIYGHVGPLPVGRLTDLFPEAFASVPEVSNALGLEYDL